MKPLELLMTYKTTIHLMSNTITNIVCTLLVWGGFCQISFNEHMSDTSSLQRILGCVVFVVLHSQEALFANAEIEDVHEISRAGMKLKLVQFVRMPA